MKIAIIIPARYQSTRLPGKPLHKIAGIPMVERVYRLAQEATKNFKNISVHIATDDERIEKHCEKINAPCVMTPPACPTGTDRVFQAALHLKEQPDFLINLQGDNPLTPPWFIENMIEAIYRNPDVDVVTPYVRLTWEALNVLRETKKVTPFSGTCVTISKDSKAFWFSKQIIPSVRKEDLSKPFSPVCRHIGLYGYSFKALKTFVCRRKRIL